MKKVAFYTLGCKVNQYETEAMTALFEKDDYEQVPFDGFSDVYVINTCTVTNLGDRKSRQMIRRAKKANPQAIIAVVGCYAQTAPEEVSAIHGVNLIIGTQDRLRIVELIAQIHNNDEQINVVHDILKTREFENMQVSVYKERTRAYIKIQEGCTQFCSYCIIPYARGPVRSRKLEDILEEVKKLSENGFQEIIFAGIHVASYGQDLGDVDLLALIESVHDIASITRIRLSSIEPMTLTERFINAIAKLPKVCAHFHLSLQSGCDHTLVRMNRKYTTEQYRTVVRNIREVLPDVSITTDIMVGFPGETATDFELSYQFVNEIQFMHTHVFQYSPRKGTPAASYEQQVRPQDKEIRSKKMLALSEKNEQLFYHKFLQRELDIIIEQPHKEKENYFEGLTSNYMRVAVLANSEMIGQSVRVCIEAIGSNILYGSVVS
ncbi:MAG: tRNA (N(6)-L-threonylcarbamoyladenosine(37)-C(2))-methylthiotransferase MtaB [Hyphomonadaceae bacterium]|nr:tRNA (N(6)-L-threonylcarbamoyladenosine(37)-C(2))-methylthiotransferase MtaB [Clostridia bacterium]